MIQLAQLTQLAQESVYELVEPDGGRMTFRYVHKAHETMYGGVMFRSRLEARWAAFFDLLRWKWEYEPVDLECWVPDFRVKEPCGHSECGGYHGLYVEVKPIESLDEAEKYWYERKFPFNSAVCGTNPSVVYGEACHGSGGGVIGPKGYGKGCLFHSGIEDLERFWRIAGNWTQWIPRPIQ
jgi:hypothetical protein